jgi:hypothetical protein
MAESSMSSKHDVDKCTDENCAVCQRIIQFYQEMQTDIGYHQQPDV